jgi:NifU-like protein involved in Fe-S cluster formation|tara:strand:- start:2564 stop:2962 length:399 start_codon:yes stop_codon:yes gene_type:complete
MNEFISKQIEPYNDLTRELFTRGAYKDNSVYPKGGVIKARKGSLDDGLVAEIVTIVDDEKIVAAKYRIYGCPHSIASIEWICEEIDGLMIDDLNKIDISSLKNLLLIPIEKTSLILLLEDVLDEIRLQLELK